jgi:hypothetical protein
MSIQIQGIYSLQDIKYDLLKIIEPFDGYMYNNVETERVVHLFSAYLTDLQHAWKLREFQIDVIEKDNAVTFDIDIKIHRDRSPKKLKIHVGRLVHRFDREPEYYNQEPA